MGGMLVAMKRRPVVVLGVIVIAVQVHVQQRQPQVADEEHDTGERSGNPGHVARVYRITSNASSTAG